MNYNFIEKAKKVHGEKYDYSLVNYTQSKNKIKIICPKHGEFEQRASGHLFGYGCSKCSHKKQTMSLNNFIEKAKKVHGEKYDYSLVNYINYDTKIKIICPKHGEFEQTPNNHLKGSNCEKCSFIDRRHKLIFIEKAKKVHGEKYDYSLVNYKTSHVKINIICQKHSEFKQTPHNHLKGHGCPGCNQSKGEEKIANLLKDKKIIFLPQHRFKNCVDKIPLPFDFYLPDYNTCIEFNGIQHYKPNEYFGGIDTFKDQQKKDKLKLQYCKNNHISLIIVKYNEKVEKIIEKLNLWEKNSKN